MKNTSSFLVLALSCLCSTEAAQFALEKRWEIAPASRPYLTASGHLQRGMAYNPVTEHLLVVNRAQVDGVWRATVHIVDAATGNDLGMLDTSAVFPAGNAQFPLSLIGVAEDGAIYAANLANPPASALEVNIYRWENEASVATLAFSGDPGNGNVQRWGDTLDVRGGGTATEVLLGSRGNIAALLTPTGQGDGTLVSTVLTLDTLPGSIGYGISFGSGDTFWGTSGAGTGGPLRLYAFDRGTGTATTILTLPHPETRAGLTLLDVLPNGSLMAGLSFENPDRIELFQVSDTGSAPVVQDSQEFPFNNDNNVYAGTVEITSDRLFVLNNNNGLVAYNIQAVTETAPVFVVQPQNQDVLSGATARFAAVVQGATPVTYQWFKGSTPLPAATNSFLVISDVTAADVADYKVVVSNAVGSQESTAASLTLSDPPPESRLQPLWSIVAGTRSYLSGSGSSQRGMAYNPVTDHVLIPHRAGGTVIIPILNGETGEEIGAMLSGFISGGSVALTQMGVAEDGVVFGCNLTTTANPHLFKLMRWQDEQSDWTIAFLDISGIGPQRWGDTMDVRGAGATTQVLVGSATAGSNAGDGRTVALFNTQNGFDFTVQEILLNGVPPFSAARGVAFGEGNTFWCASDNGTVSHMEYDLGSGTATLRKSYTGIPNTGAPLDVSNGLLGIVSVGSPDRFSVYEIPSGEGDLIPLADPVSFPTDNGNSTLTGSVAFGADKVFAHNTNNGLMAFRIRPKQETPPPSIRASFAAGKVVLTWPTTAQGFQLQSRPALGQGSWTLSDATATIEGNSNVVRVDPSGEQFFQLIK